MHPHDLFLSEASLARDVPVYADLFGVYQAVHQQSRRHPGNFMRDMAHPAVQSPLQGRDRPRAGAIF